jgi:SAM-dependent methyltransferase
LKSPALNERTRPDLLIKRWFFMRDSLLAYLRCSECGAALSARPTEIQGEEVWSGELACSQCAAQFPVGAGVPRMLRNEVPSTRTQRSFGRQWVLHSQGSFERDLIYSKSRAECLEDFRRAFGLQDLAELRNCVILDAGCGSGELTADIGRAAPGATVVGMDFSDAARVAFERCRGISNVHIVQADLSRPPFPARSFDLVWSEGVIHHTPDTASSFASLSQLVKPHGKLYVWIYSDRVTTPYRLARKLLHKPYLLPSAALYGLSWSLALPLHTLNKLREMFRLSQVRHRLSSTAYSFYDTLSPEFVHFHSQEEVQGWFTRQNFDPVIFLNGSPDIAACGTKK